MKKILLVLMAIIMALSLIACNDEEKPSQSSTPESTTADSDNGSGTTDSSGAEQGGTDNGTDNGTDDGTDGADATGLVLTQAVIKQLEESASMKLSFDLEIVATGDEWYRYDKITNEKSYFEGIANFTTYISKAENGYNLKVEAELSSREYEDEELEREMKGGVLYIVDGVVYEYNEVLDAYLLSELPTADTTALEETVALLVEEAGLTEEEIDSALNELGNLFIESFGVSNNRGYAYVDLQENINGVLAYLKELDVENTTLRTLCNDLLAAIDENSTIEGALEGMEQFYDMTLSEYLTALDESLVAEYGMTMQEIYDSVVASEAVQALIEDYVLSINPEATDEEIQAYIDEITSMSLTEIIPEEMMEMKLYDLIMTILGSAEDIAPDDGAILMSYEEYPSLDEFMEIINDYFDMTLAEWEEERGAYLFSLMVSLANCVEVDAYNTTLDVEFTGIFQIQSITCKEELALTITTQSEVSSKKNIYSISINASYALVELSQEEYPITAPTDKDTVNDVFDKYFYSEEGYALELTIDDEYEIVELTVTALVPSSGGQLEYLILAEPTADCFDGYEIVLSTDQVYYYFDGELPLTLTITLYPELEMFTYEAEMCEHIWGSWSEDADLGMAYRQCAVCGQYDVIELDVTYTITYHNMEGATNPNSDSYSSADDVFTLLSPTKIGYLFGGWYLDEELTMQVFEVDPSIMGDLELYAKWTELIGPESPSGEGLEPTSRWDGETLNVLATVWNTSEPCAPWSQVELTVSSLGYDAEKGFGELISTAVLEREQYIKNEYGVYINWINSRGTTISNILSEAVASGDMDYHIAMPRALEAQTLVGKSPKLLYDISNSQYIDLDASYYSQAAREAYTINNVTLFAAGDFSFFEEQTSSVIFFNGAILEELADAPDLYQLVREGKWTIDEMINISKLVSGSYDSAGQGDEGVYGFSTNNLSLFYQHSGIKQVSVENGKYVISMDNSNVDTLIDKLLTITKADWARLSWDGGMSMANTAFQEKRLLFYNDVVQKTQSFAEQTDDFNVGVLPVPKLSDGQESYNTSCTYMTTLMCIPRTTPDRDMSECFLEVLSYTGQQYIMKAYKQELMSDLYANAEDNYEMLEEYIFANISYDLGYMHSWDGVLTSVQNSSYSSGVNNFDYLYADAYEKATTTVLDWNSNWASYATD